MTETQNDRGNGAVQIREEFSAREMTVRAETAAVAVAAQARAVVESRFILAQRKPRDWDEVRVKILKACARPGFAATARYRKPIGKGVEGPSIRFAEEAIRSMGNILPEATVIYDDDAKRIIRVSVTDLENNVTYSSDATVQKTVERSKLAEGQQVLGVRANSQGRKTYLVAATEDDLLNKQNAIISKALRTNALRLLPGDILEEAMDAAIATVTTKDAKDPDEARKKLADAFAKLGVLPAALAAYLGHDLAACSPAEVTDLRATWAAINDGEATWHDVVEARQAERGIAAQEGKATEAPASGLKAKLKADAAKAAEREPGAEG